MALTVRISTSVHGFRVALSMCRYLEGLNHTLSKGSPLCSMKFNDASAYFSTFRICSFVRYLSHTVLCTIPRSVALTWSKSAINHYFISSAHWHSPFEKEQSSSTSPDVIVASWLSSNWLTRSIMRELQCGPIRAVIYISVSWYLTIPKTYYSDTESSLKSLESFHGDEFRWYLLARN